MKVLKGIGKGVFWLVVFALLAAPVYMIYRISNEEMKQYEPKPVPVFRETAYGEIAKAKRMDVSETVTVSGVCTSDAFVYQDLNQREIQNARWFVRENDEVQEGQVIAELNGTEVVSVYTGIVREINTYAKSPYMKVQLLEPVEIECSVDTKTLKTLERSRESLCTEAGEAVTLTHVALTKNIDGSTKIRLRIDSDAYAYGMEVKDLSLFTGNRFLSALVLNAKCLYEKEPGSGEWYARRVAEDGAFLEEVKVEVGYRSDPYVCVSGVNEGDCFDTGYRAIAGGGAYE